MPRTLFGVLGFRAPVIYGQEQECRAGLQGLNFIDEVFYGG